MHYSMSHCRTRQLPESIQSQLNEQTHTLSAVQVFVCLTPEVSKFVSEWTFALGILTEVIYWNATQGCSCALGGEVNHAPPQSSASLHFL